MIEKTDYQPCCCDPPCCEQAGRTVRRNAINLGLPPEEYQRVNYQKGYDYKNKKQLNNNYKVNAETVDALAGEFAVRQRAYNNYPGPDLQTVTEPSYKTSSQYPPQRGGADVRRQADMIDYTPESEFLKRMKQQCEYLRNNEENIFTTLDELGLHDYFPFDQSKNRLNFAVGDFKNERRTASKPVYQEEGKPHSKTTRTLFSNVDLAKKHKSVYSFDKKSEHISRSKKPSYYRGRRKRTSSEKSDSRERFEPTLKKPHEDSCERCWRYASPARSPVNKPDQKFDPNFRRAHSNPDFERGDSYFQVPSRPQTPQIIMQPYANKEGRRPLTPNASDWQRVEAQSKTKTGLSQQQLMSGKASKRSVVYSNVPQTREARQHQGVENWQSQKEMWRPETPVSRQGYEIPDMGPISSNSQRQQFVEKTTRPLKMGVSRSQTKMQDSRHNIAPQRWLENKPSAQQTSSAMNYQNYYSATERPPRPKSCTPGIGYAQGYRQNVVEECIRHGYRNPFSNAPDPDLQTNNNQRQQARTGGPKSSFVAPGLFCYRGHNPKACGCICIPPSQQHDICPLPPKCPTGNDFEDEFCPDAHPQGGRSPGGRPREGRSLAGRSPGGRSPGGRSPGGRSPGGRSTEEGSPDEEFLNDSSPVERSGGRGRGGRSPGARSPSGRIPGARSPSGRSPGGLSPSGRSPDGRADARATQQTSASQRQNKAGKGTPKTPVNTVKPGFPHSDSTVYADLPPGRGPDDVSFLDKSSARSRKKGNARTPSPKRSPKGKREGGKSPKRSPSSPRQKSGRKVSPKSSKSSKSPKSTKSSKSSKSPRSSKSPKSQKASTSEEESSKARQRSSKSRSKSVSRVSSKSPSKSSPKQALNNLPTSQTSQGPPNEVLCTYDGNIRPQTACAEFNYASAYPSNKIPHDQFKGMQVYRECCCSARQARYDDVGNCVLCCHCNYERPYQNPNVETYPAGPSRTPVNTRPIIQTNTWRGGTPPRNMAPENFNQVPGAQDDDLDEYVNCPYKPKSVRLWQLSDQKKKIPYPSNMGPILESQDNGQPPYGYDVNPKTYFVFHMRKCKPGKGNDVEVLVEETAKPCPDRKEKKSKNVTEKMKKIMECPSDSMALRFQKGVSESRQTPQNSRILYF